MDNIAEYRHSSGMRNYIQEEKDDVKWYTPNAGEKGRGLTKIRPRSLVLLFGQLFSLCA